MKTLSLNQRIARIRRAYRQSLTLDERIAIVRMRFGLVFQPIEENPEKSA